MGVAPLRPAKSPPRWTKPSPATAAAIAAIALIAAALVAAPGRLAPEQVTDDSRQPAGVPGPLSSPSAPAGAPAPTPTAPAPEDPSPSASAPVDAPGDTDTVTVTLAEQLLQRINEIRQARGRRALLDDADLERVAVTHVGEMISERVTGWRLLAESIGVGPDLHALVDAFLHSEVDRRNMLDAQFWHVGVGAVRTRQRLWVTILFSDRNDPGTSLPSTES